MFDRNGRNGNGHRGPLAGIADRVRERLPQGVRQALPLIADARTREGREKIVKQTRESGFKVADDTMRAVSAGMGIADVRAMFRGDPPIEKPNPRYKVFTNAFFAHIRPRYYEKSSTKFTHTFGLGFLSAFTFFVETITGIILMVFYIPGTNDAYQSMVKIITEVPFGQLMRDIHRVGAELMVIFVALHMFRVYLTGSFKHPRQFTWVTGVVLLILTLGLSYSGYLLPWDQLAYWAITVGSNIALAVPVIGNKIHFLLLGGNAVNANALLRFYVLHCVILPLAAVVLIAVHFWRIRKDGGLYVHQSEPARVKAAAASATPQADIPKPEAK